MVLNVRELMHIFRRVWQDFGPFPLIGCDSECLAWHITGDDTLKAPKGHEVLSNFLQSQKLLFTFASRFESLTVFIDTINTLSISALCN